MKLLTRIEKSKNFWFLFILLFGFFLLRLPSLIEPYWYGDEGIYQTIGLAIRDGKLLYRDIWDNKPPLLYLAYALFWSDQFAVRAFSLCLGTLSLISFFFLAKNLFKQQKTVWTTTTLYGILFGLPILEGNIANSENFMLLPIISASYLLIRSVAKSYKNMLPFFGAGLLLGIALLFKVVAVFDFAALLLFLFFVERKKSPIVKTAIGFTVGFLLPMSLAAAFFLSNGAFSEFFSASFTQNVGYVGYGNKFLFANGLLVVKLFFMGAFLLFLFIKRNSIFPSHLFIFVWLAFSLYNAFFSQRPYTHYLLVLLPSFCLWIGLVGETILRKQRERTIIYTLITGVLLFLLSQNFWVYGKITSYYQNALLFLTNKKSVEDYQAFFDRKTPHDYQIAQFIF